MNLSNSSSAIHPALGKHTMFADHAVIEHKPCETPDISQRHAGRLSTTNLFGSSPVADSRPDIGSEPLRANIRLNSTELPFLAIFL